MGMLAFSSFICFVAKKIEVENYSFIFPALQLNEDCSMNNPG